VCVTSLIFITPAAKANYSNENELNHKKGTIKILTCEKRVSLLLSFAHSQLHNFFNFAADDDYNDDSSAFIFHMMSIIYARLSCRFPAN
jgi:hypothetical protein